MAELLEDASGLESTTIGIFRTSTTVKGGRRFSFGALVVVGDRNGNVGLGYAKAPGVPSAIEKAQKYARKKMYRIRLQEGTIPHATTGSFGASCIKLVPASPGTGVIAGGTVRAVLELAGIKDCLTKSVGSANKINLARAAMLGLTSMLTKQAVEELRGVKLADTVVEKKLAAGRRFAPASTAAPRPAPVRAKRDERRGGGKGRGGPNRGGPNRGRDHRKPDAAPGASPQPPAGEQPQA